VNGLRGCVLMWLCCALVISGCDERAVPPVESLPVATPPPEERRQAGGAIELGSPSLTAGIAGAGPLKLAEVEPWLANSENHEPLDLALPTHLAEGFDLLRQIPADNPITRAKIELGRQLFFDGRFSASGALACGDCHHPAKAYTNFIGKYGPLRDPLPAFNRVLGSKHFWDGHAATLEDQVHTPVGNEREMHTTPEAIIGKLRASEGYRRQFEVIFGAVTFTAYSQALACFERVLVTGPSAWDRHQAGEKDALSAAAERGAALFFSERTQCSTCHSGPNFSDESFHVLGPHYDAPRNGGEPDFGRFHVTHDERDRNAFRTPTLRNVARTTPYFHDGRFDTLPTVVRWFNDGGHAEGKDTELVPVGLSDSEVADLVAFLEALNSDLPPVETKRLPE
jgi:cytochrome c peroxidase